EGAPAGGAASAFGNAGAQHRRAGGGRGVSLRRWRPAIAGAAPCLAADACASAAVEDSRPQPARRSAAAPDARGPAQRRRRAPHAAPYPRLAPHRLGAAHARALRLRPAGRGRRSRRGRGRVSTPPPSARRGAAFLTPPRCNFAHSSVAAFWYCPPMRHLGVVLLCFAVGCGATNPTHGGGGSGGTGGGGTGGTAGGGTGGTGGGGTGGSGGGTGSGDCSDAAKLIYVIDQDGTFSSFKPDQTDITKSVFTDLGKLNCSGASLYQPFSMSVDRNAVAWVELAPLGGGASKLFNVSTANAACTPTTFMGGQQGFNEFGMGFVSNTAMSTDETLFIGGGDMVGGTSNLGT